MKTKLALFAAVLLGNFAATLPARAGYEDDAAMRQLAVRLADTAEAYSSRGWFLHDFEPSFIHTGAATESRVWLDAGDRIIFRGLGDNDAIDLDIAVFDSNGRRVAHDGDYDATPLVNFTVRRSGYFTVRLGVIACHSNGSYCGLLMAEQ